MIETLRKIARLDWDRRWLLAEAVVVHAVMNVFVRVMSASWIRRRTATPRVRGRASSAPTSVRWAVANAAARLPGSTCLTSALAAHLMLTRRGGEAVVRFGVAPPAARGGTPRFHAWVECDGRGVDVVDVVDIFIGAESLESYRALESCSATAARIANRTAFAGR